MKIYLVGGAVRDKLLNIKNKEKDWVVIGSTINEMIKNGFKIVGKDFPVFLHPKTNEEYALARTEKKQGHGYKGFKIYTSPDISLKEDLKRRDLTINAMAIDENDNIIDYFGGLNDIKKKIIRHVSENFADDPLRILRVCRFTSKLPNFKIHKSTINLMRQIVKNGEIKFLNKYRIWQEIYKSLNELHSERFFINLKKCNALNEIFPNISNNYSQGIILLRRNKLEQPKIKFALYLLSIYKNYNELINLNRNINLPNEYLIICSLIFQNYKLFEQHNTDYKLILNLIIKLDGIRRYNRAKCIINIISKILDYNKKSNKYCNFVIKCCEEIKKSKIYNLKKYNQEEIKKILYNKYLIIIKNVFVNYNNE